MIVLCCPVNLMPATAAALAEHAPGAQIVRIPAGDITRPWRDYAARWATDDLVVIEQDIIIHADVIPQFEACPEPWCLFPFRHYAQGGGWMKDGIGCNRFRREFMEAVPVEAVEAQGGSCNRCNGENRQCWAHLDGRTREAGEAAGFRIHVHWPSVGHRDVLPGETMAYRPDGTWSCTVDHVAEPCGQCVPCRTILASHSRSVEI